MTDPLPAAVAAVLAGQVRGGSRGALARAVTLVESTRVDHRAQARELVGLLAAAVRDDPPAVRIGLSGTPGAGKSTLIERLGGALTDRGHRVGVLAVDPSSPRTGGSVLGDKTRMPTLATDPNAYIRPSPTAGTLGGVTRATAQAITVLEGAGYDVVIVETVGVGQSEAAVAQMVDSFVLLGLARAGDQLQGIKKGVLEIADVVAINKADGDRAVEARSAAGELAGALRLVRSGPDAWLPPVITCSGLTGDGLDRLWQAVLDHREHLGGVGLSNLRAEQRWELVRALVRDDLDQRWARSAPVIALRDDVRAAVVRGELSAPAAADTLMAAFLGSS
ncbi:MAG: methylmalonyl Co-A mutase-associated GTPase MeaB [Nakamurella sp.]